MKFLPPYLFCNIIVRFVTATVLIYAGKLVTGGLSGVSAGSALPWPLLQWSIHLGFRVHFRHHHFSLICCTFLFAGQCPALMAHSCKTRVASFWGDQEAAPLHTGGSVGTEGRTVTVISRLWEK